MEEILVKTLRKDLLPSPPILSVQLYGEILSLNSEKGPAPISREALHCPHGNYRYHKLISLLRKLQFERFNINFWLLASFHTCLSRQELLEEHLQSVPQPLQQHPASERKELWQLNYGSKDLLHVPGLSHPWGSLAWPRDADLAIACGLPDLKRYCWDHPGCCIIQPKTR